MTNENKTLIKITSNAMMIAARITQEAMENDGEISESTDLLLQENDQDLAVKVENYRNIIDQLEMQATLIKQREEGLAKIRKALASKVGHLEYNLRHALETMSLDKLEGMECYYKLVRGKPNLSIEDQSKIPLEFKKEIVSTETVIDKEGIVENLKAGFTVEGCRMKENYSLRKYNKKV